MYNVEIQNSNGDILTLTQKETDFQIISITGLNPPSAQINNSTVAGKDGTIFNSSKLNNRNIVITIKINGEVSQNRQLLYRYFVTKDKCRFYFENENATDMLGNALFVYIDGYVENFECDLFQNGQTAQISIICPDPYFKSMIDWTDDLSKATNNFYFEFAIDDGDPIPFSEISLEKTVDVFNYSENPTGLTIKINVLAGVNEIKIVNTGTGETLTLNYNFIANDKIIIDTNKGNKSITLIRNGQNINIFGALKKGSTFFQLKVADNFFSYLVDNGSGDENVEIIFNHTTLYRGV